MATAPSSGRRPARRPLRSTHGRQRPRQPAGGRGRRASVDVAAVTSAWRFPRRPLGSNWASALHLHQIAKRVGVRGEEQPVLVASRPPFRFDDIGEARHRQFHVAEPENPPPLPHALEILSRHHERKIDVETGAIRRQIEGFTRAPSGERVIRIRWKEQVAVLGREQHACGSRIVIGARKPDDDEPDGVAVQPLDQAIECVYHCSARNSGVMRSPLAHGMLDPALVRTGLVLRQGLAPSDRPAVRRVEVDWPARRSRASCPALFHGGVEGRPHGSRREEPGGEDVIR